MEILIGGIFGCLFGVTGMSVYRYATETRGKRQKQSCVIYLLRVDPTGKVEIKTAPIQLWTWKY